MASGNWKWLRRRGPGPLAAICSSWASLARTWSPAVPGCEALNTVYMTGAHAAALLVHCPSRLRPPHSCRAGVHPAGHLFTVGTCAKIAGVDEAQILGPSWHCFTDARHFAPRCVGAGRRLDRDDWLLAGLRGGVRGDGMGRGQVRRPRRRDEWDRGDGRLAAAGNLGPIPACPAISARLPTRPPGAAA